MMKFGGTSVAELDKIQRAADRAIAARKRGNKVIAVVSAPADLTDDLLCLAKRVSKRPDERELDMLLGTGEMVSISLLAMAIKDRGYDAISLTGGQAGITTDGKYANAAITGIKPSKILRELEKGKIVVVAGFQGISPQCEITTLGRGGSDLTAVAVASAVKAGACEIYTDVKGIYTADPRIAPQAKKLGRISYEEMLELACAGAQVMQAKSIKAAREADVALHVRSSFFSEPGTWICKTGLTGRKKPAISCIAVNKELVIIQTPAASAGKIADFLKKSKIGHAAFPSAGKTFFALSQSDFEKHAFTAKLLKNTQIHGNMAIISIIGSGIMKLHDMPARALNILEKQKIYPLSYANISHMRLSLLMPSHYAEKAVRNLHKGLI